ncbi:MULTISPECIES: helix-turn-helix domain-containing protein [Lachnospiraceae]|nr:helix-turn-helix transcriptional regulator [Roseburia intestinalis]MDO4276739.1 helix-turn-helix transcriptional regulator [Eubacteriales bacterium]
MNDRVTKAAKFMYLAAFFCLWTGNFATRCHKVKFIVEGGTVLGNRAGSQELIQLGERIRQKRKDSHLTQETFAEKAGISVNTVSRIEGGQAAMSIEIFAKLVEILDADANELLGRNPEEMGNPAHRMFSRVKNLRPKEQKIVIQTMSALMDGIEGIR